ncbi:hypothetical protein DXT88_00180 [Herbaspirillum lusitanum]|nr:hypothetical protein [Herbaspirillum lusitanum]
MDTLARMLFYVPSIIVAARDAMQSSTEVMSPKHSLPQQAPGGTFHARLHLIYMQPGRHCTVAVRAPPTRQQGRQPMDIS